MTSEEFAAIVAAGERLNVEFKGARARGDKNFNEVARAVMGMANRLDGGLVIIGVDRTGKIEGLSPAQLASWSNPDHIRDHLAPRMQPRVYVDVEIVTPASALACVVLAVREFDLVPVLCTQDSHDHKGELVLRKGACYVRSSHTPATTEVADYPAFRELLDLAISKGVRRFVARAVSAGLQVGGSPTTEVADEEKFKAQKADAFK